MQRKIIKQGKQYSLTLFWHINYLVPSGTEEQFYKAYVSLLMLIKIRHDFDRSNISYFFNLIKPEVIALYNLDILGLLSNFQNVIVL